ncbi:expansin EXLX1 family cellulose-binding protein [Nonomuraea sp. NPDC050536]|uniref:expansin EXLX1 family cellulose-binding protein n=1 Tax=Nonomuraea sp. NPDC050536 TaxID=3364366 RepID=UPI0037C71D7A
MLGVTGAVLWLLYLARAPACAATPVTCAALPADLPAALYATVSSQEYGGAAACGGYLDVTGPRGTVRVQITGACADCRAGEVDLSRAAYGRIAEPGRPVTAVTYRQVKDPQLREPLGFRIKQGSTPDRLAVQVVDHGNPLRSVDVRVHDRWRAMKRRADGSWAARNGAGDGPFTFRVTDVRGHRKQVGDLDLLPGRIQRSDVFLYGSARAVPLPTIAATPVRRSC